MSDYDSPWREALDLYFERFLAFFFFRAHADIDWTHGYEMLETELQQVAREATLGPHRADKLVKVWLRDGQEAWILIHVEVQSQEEEGFPRRMFTYNYRIFDLYNRTVVSRHEVALEEWQMTEPSFVLASVQASCRPMQASRVTGRAKADGKNVQGDARTIRANQARERRDG